MLSAKFVKIATLEGYLFVLRATAYSIDVLWSTKPYSKITQLRDIIK
jgi:hypothetical protein